MVDMKDGLLLLLRPDEYVLNKKNGYILSDCLIAAVLGMNPAIRGVTRYALDKGIAVEGILRGYEGLLRQESILLDQRSVGEIIHRGGTMLRTARCEAFIHVSLFLWHRYIGTQRTYCGDT